MANSPSGPAKLNPKVLATLVFFGKSVVFSILIALATGAIFLWLHAHSLPLYKAATVTVPKIGSSIVYAILSGVFAILHRDLQWVVQTEPFRAGVSLGLCLSPLLGPAFTLIWDRWFPSMDPTVHIDIPTPSPFDPLWGSGVSLNIDKDQIALPWVESHDLKSTQFTAWKRLRQFAYKGASYRRFSFFQKPEDDTSFLAFDWAIITGVAGSGKSRTCVEFLRRILGHKHHHEPGTHYRPLHRRVAHRSGEVVRRALWFKTLHPEHAWDVIWIKPGSSDRDHRHATRNKVSQPYLDALTTWRPRRPTAFLLDDPLPHDTQKVIAALESKSDKYNFPVRLLIANQTVPQELDLTYDGNAHTWSLDHRPVTVIVLEAKQNLTVYDIYEMADQMPSPLRGWKNPRNNHIQSQLKALHQISAGNPMLVELGLRLMLEDKDIGQETAYTLIQSRARRVKDALVREFNNKELEDTFLQTLASCTLAAAVELWHSTATVESPSPALPEGPDATTNPLHPEIAKYNTVLWHCFNLASTGGVPGVRPQQVGEAFVQLVLQENCRQSVFQAVGPEDPVQQNEVAYRAWRFSAEGTLNSVKRLAAQPSRLGRILRLDPPPPSEDGPIVDPQALALACAQAAIQYPDGQAAAFFDPTILTVTCQRLAALTPEQAEACLPYIYKLLRLPLSSVVVAVEGQTPKTQKLLDPELTPGVFTRNTIGALIFFNAVDRMLQGNSLHRHLEEPGRASAIQLLHSCNNVRDAWHVDELGEDFVEFTAAGHALQQLTAQTTADLPPTMQPRADLNKSACVLGFINQSLLPASFRYDYERVRLLRAVAWFTCQTHNAVACKAACQALDALVSTVPLEPAWAYHFELLRANAWCQICFILSQPQSLDILECKQSATHIDAIAAPFHQPGSVSDMELSRARAWSSVCTSLSQAPDPSPVEECWKMAERVDSISTASRGTKLATLFDFQRASAWRSVAVTAVDYLQNCQKAVEIVRSIVLHPSVTPDRAPLFQRELAAAYRFLTLSWSRITPPDPENCRLTAEIVAGIAKKNTLDPRSAPKFILEWVGAYTALCGSLAAAGPGHLGNLRGCVRLVHQLTIRFRQSPLWAPRFEFQCVQATRSLNLVLSRLGPEYAEECQGLCQHIETLYLLYAADPYWSPLFRSVYDKAMQDIQAATQSITDPS